MREWLREKRRAKAWTQEEVAKRAGIARSYYTRIERGEYRVPALTAKKIANALSCDWQQFYEF